MKHKLFAGSLNNCLTILVLAILAPFASVAQSERVITLDQAIQMGMDASYQLKISQGKFDYAQAKHDETYDLQYPSAKLSTGYSRLSDVPPFQIQTDPNSPPTTVFPVFVNSYQSHVSLNEIVFAGFRVKTAKESADKALNASQYDLKKDKDDVKLNIITAYYNLYKVQQAIGIIDQNLTLIDQRLKDIQNLAANGLATHADELRVELQQSNTQLTKIDARNIFLAANYNFNLLIGLPGDVTITLDTSSLFRLKSLESKDVFISNALQNRPEVQSIMLRNQAAEDNVKIARNSYWPTVSAGANLYPASPNQRYVPPTDVFHTTWDVGLTLNWDITNLFTNRHSIAEYTALLDQGTAQQGQLNDGIKSEVYQNYLAYSEALEKLDVLNKAVLTAEENLKVTDSRYKNSIALISDLTDAQNAQLQAQIDLVIAKADAQIAYYKLQKSTGSF